MSRVSVVFLARSTAAVRFSKDFSPNPSISVISALWRCSRKRSGSVRMKPRSIGFSIVDSERPSILSAFLLAKRSKRLICLAGQSGFVQCSVLTPLFSWTSVGAPQTGQVSGTGAVPLFVRFSAICGMIIFAL